MITRSGLLEIFVLLAGLICGFVIYRFMENPHNRVRQELPELYVTGEIPSPFSLNLSTVYGRSKEQMEQMEQQNRDAIRQAARRSQLLQQSRNRVTIDRDAYDRLIFQAELEVDLLRLKGYYSQFYMYYYHWLDSGDAKSSVQYKLAMGQFKATLDYFQDKYRDGEAFSVDELEKLRGFIRIAEQNNRTIRWARVELVVLIFLLLMGIPGFIRSSGVKRFSASLFFDSVFRPYLVSDLHSWHSIRRLAIAFILLYILGIFIFFSFTSWEIPIILGLLGLTPVTILIILSRQSRRFPTLLVSYMAPRMLIVMLILGMLALRGAGSFWYRFWDSEAFRGILTSLFFMLIFHKFQVNIILARKWSRRSRIGSASMVWLALGIELLLACTLLYSFGPEESLLALNRALLLMPQSLLADPLVLLRWLVFTGGVLTAGPLLIFFISRRNSNRSPGRKTG